MPNPLATTATTLSAEERQELLHIARHTIDIFLETRKKPPLPKINYPTLQEPRGAFVTLHHRDGSLRGCIGTFQPCSRANVPTMLGGLPHGSAVAGGENSLSAGR